MLLGLWGRRVWNKLRGENKTRKNEVGAMGGERRIRRRGKFRTLLTFYMLR
jgi:hypothetical protein